MNVSRRSFLGSAAGALAFGGSRTANALAKVPTHDFKWIDLVHLGMKMWGDLPLDAPPPRNGIMTKVLTDEEFAAIWQNPEHRAKDRLHFDEPFWKELSLKLRQSGCNTILIDVGEGLRYPSHPELALKDSWSPEKLKTEIDRLRGMGFEVFPKLNFSTSHDAWLGPYERMVSTPKYYEVCADVIRDTMEVFGPVKNFHIGFDEEDVPKFQSNSSILVIRKGDLWWHDFNWFVREVEKHGARAWAWSDYLRRHTKEQFKSEFCRKMPKTVVQNPWMYWTTKEKMATEPYIQAYLTLAEAGYDLAPCGSNCYGVTANFPDMAEYCKEKIPATQFKGMIMAPWIKTIAPYRRLHWQAADIMAEARRRTGIS